MKCFLLEQTINDDDAESEKQKTDNLIHPPNDIFFSGSW